MSRPDGHVPFLDHVRTDAMSRAGVAVGEQLFVVGGEECERDVAGVARVGTLAMLGSPRVREEAVRMSGMFTWSVGCVSYWPCR